MEPAAGRQTMIDQLSQLGALFSNWLGICLILGGLLVNGLSIRFATRRALNETRKALDVAVAQSQADDERIAERVVHLERVTDRLSNRLDNSPTRKELHQVVVEIKDMQKDMSALAASMHGFTDLLRRLETSLNSLLEHHINLGQRK